MAPPTLAGRRVLVIGASSGIGQAVAIRAVQAGATVALVARRAERLADTIATAGGGTAIVADLRAPDDCARIGIEAAAALGQIDLVFIAAGATTLSWLDGASAADWALAFETNVIGVNLVIAALLPHLLPGGLVAACSSESVGHPRSGLVTYSSSKAALEESLRGWRVEHPDRRFSCVAVGATVPTDFGSSWDPAKVGQALDEWARQGEANAALMRTDDVAEVLVDTLAVACAHPTVSFDELTLRSPAGRSGTADSMVDDAIAAGMA